MATIPMEVLIDAISQLGPEERLKLMSVTKPREMTHLRGADLLAEIARMPQGDPQTWRLARQDLENRGEDWDRN